MDFWVTRQADRQTSIDKRKDSKKDRQTAWRLQDGLNDYWCPIYTTNQLENRQRTNRRQFRQTDKEIDKETCRLIERNWKKKARDISLNT